MTFPTITHINDVLPAIAGRAEFRRTDHGAYQVIDYTHALPDSFDDPMRLECRGIKFDAAGNILARPLHKFFNVGERDDTQPHVLPFHEPHTVMEKMDGSMIHPAVINGEVVFMTRAGRTEHARKAERHLTRELNIAFGTIAGKATPIFEWTAPDNRIVVPYAESRLTLLAVRVNETGLYYPNNILHDWAADFGVHAAPIHITPNNAADFIAHARALKGMEGFVVRWRNGFTVKAKGEDYVLKHKAKESILQEKNVLALVLRGELDDVLPLLEPYDRACVERYAKAVEVGVTKATGHVDDIVCAGRTLDQKVFATRVVPCYASHLRPLAFQVRAGKDARAAITDAILKKCGSQTCVDSVRPLFGAKFGLSTVMEAA